jgi:hypothetical protein
LRCSHCRHRSKETLDARRVHKRVRKPVSHDGKSETTRRPRAKRK